MTVLHRLLLTVFFLIAVSPVFAAGPSEHVRAIVSGIVTYTRWPSLTGAPKLCIFASSRFTHSLAHEDPDALPYQPVIVRNREEALKRPAMVFILAANRRLNSQNSLAAMARGRCYSSQNKIRIVQLVARFA